ncbi:hypothetical protein Taro_003518, partial [Colocasia esculenta]|nr:hypothetical protein [Colocasia esculenta]
ITTPPSSPYFLSPILNPRRPEPLASVAGDVVAPPPPTAGDPSLSLLRSHSGSRVRRLRTVDGVPSHSSEDSIAGHPSQALLPITQGTSSTASASSSVAETSSWGRGTGR